MEQEAADSAGGEALGHRVWAGSLWEGSGRSGLPRADAWGGGGGRDSLSPAARCVGAGLCWLGLEGLRPSAWDWNWC